MKDFPPDLLVRLHTHGQAHLAEGWGELTPTASAAFVEQLTAIDFVGIAALYGRKDEAQAGVLARARLAPIPIEDGYAISAASRAFGEEALKRGEVAALVVAGGQGSRLGFDKPKGMYPVGPVTGATLFQFHAEKVLALGRRYGKPVPFLVMTSPATDADTRTFFAEHRNFGLASEDVYFFQQGTMPALDIATGRLLLEEPGSLFLGPNGHGGTLTALADTGLLGRLRERGVRHVFYFQVDNPLVNVCDTGFVGRHVEVESEASSRSIRKENPDERVGILASVDGRCGIVEYSDLPPEVARERDGDGSLRFRAGSPAIHVFSVAFLDRITSRVGGEGGMKYHIARKKVAHYDPTTGKVVTPVVENALKFEMFIFDALPLADRWLVVQARREDEFAPLKNATGADSPDTVRDALVNRFSVWLEGAGVAVPRGEDGRPTHPVEIAPSFAMDAEELRRKLPSGFVVSGPTLLR